MAKVREVDAAEIALAVRELCIDINDVVSDDDAEATDPWRREDLLPEICRGAGR
jgi:hypothetical protein